MINAVKKYVSVLCDVKQKYFEMSSIGYDVGDVYWLLRLCLSFWFFSVYETNKRI